MSIQTDSQGRLYLPSELRQQYGERFHVVRYEDRVELIPISDDPLQAARAAVGDAFEGMSIEELREEALETAKREAREDLGRPEAAKENE